MQVYQIYLPSTLLFLLSQFARQWRIRTWAKNILRSFFKKFSTFQLRAALCCNDELAKKMEVGKEQTKGPHQRQSLNVLVNWLNILQYIIWNFPMYLELPPDSSPLCPREPGLALWKPRKGEQWPLKTRTDWDTDKLLRLITIVYQLYTVNCWKSLTLCPRV